jgi:hypothetical protein
VRIGFSFAELSQLFIRPFTTKRFRLSRCASAIQIASESARAVLYQVADGSRADPLKKTITFPSSENGHSATIFSAE